MIFNFGDWFSGIIDSLVEMWTPGASTILGGEDSFLFKIIWNGLFNGLMGGLGGVLPFVFAFFIFIEIMQDVGYLPRAAYLMDRFLQRLGVHGKTIIPILLGFGCNVPAISAASIMETEKEKRRAILIGSMIPCSAVATIVMGLVGKYLGIEYAWLLYLVSFTSIIIVGRILANLDVAVESELIIELHDFRKPNFKVILKQTWNRCKEFVYLALPLIVIISGLMEILMQFDLLNPVNTFLSPITVGLLGLPIGIGVYFLYGILRKELNLVLLELFVTVSLGSSMLEYLSPIQMIVFCVITMIYIPCVAVIFTIKKESGIHYAILISVLEVLLAVVIAGAIRWINVLILLIIPDIADLVGITITFIIFFILVGIFLLILPNMMDIHNKQELTAIKPNLIPSSDCYGKSCNSSDMCKNCGYKR
ncbi:MAG: ferrous iron transporter B [archaeon]|nr:ferrous iron transporter B [archaeon]